jgi:hypothetical protein
MGLSGGLRMTGKPLASRRTRPCDGISSARTPIFLAWNAKEAMMKLAPLSLAALLAALPAHALEPINTEPHINNVLLQGFIGDAIADNCPALEPRRMRALGELNKLRVYALDKGYTTTEVRAFVTSDTEKARGKAEAAEWLKARGAEPGKTDEYCRIGREEIAKESLIGYLLRDTE